MTSHTEKDPPTPFEVESVKEDEKSQQAAVDSNAGVVVDYSTLSTAETSPNEKAPVDGSVVSAITDHASLGGNAMNPPSSNAAGPVVSSLPDADVPAQVILPDNNSDHSESQTLPSQQAILTDGSAPSNANSTLPPSSQSFEIRTADEPSSLGQPPPPQQQQQQASATATSTIPVDSQSTINSTSAAPPPDPPSALEATAGSAPPPPPQQVPVSNEAAAAAAAPVVISTPPAPQKQSQQQTTGAPSILLDKDSDDTLDDYIRSPEIQNAIAERSPGGRYVRFLEKLGSGASKDVFRAYDTQEGIEVAWNVVTLSGVPKTERNRIVNEVRLLERLHHPNIISFHGSWVNRERQEVNFVTEILSSGTLKSFINKVQVIRWKIAKRWAKQILQGLEYLHSQDPPVIHRDLKCENVFINGTSGDLRIGDLGLSTVHRNGRVLSVLGTPEFMAPDLYEERAYDEKVDIYAFGMCMLEIFTKEIPYSECNNPAQIYKKVSAGEPPEILSRIQSRHARDFVELCLGYKDETGTYVRPPASELLKHPFLMPRSNDQDEVVVERPLRERPITEGVSENSNGSSMQQIRRNQDSVSSSAATTIATSVTTAAANPSVNSQQMQAFQQPQPPHNQPQPQEQRLDSAPASTAAPSSSTPRRTAPDPEEDGKDQFDEMPESETNMKKVKVLMGRDQVLTEDDGEEETQPPAANPPAQQQKPEVASVPVPPVYPAPQPQQDTSPSVTHPTQQVSQAHPETTPAPAQAESGTVQATPTQVQPQSEVQQQKAPDAKKKEGSHYLVAAAVIEPEGPDVRPYADEILKLVVTLPVEGQTQNVQFEFHLVEDDAVKVAKEMVEELEIPQEAVLEISETISGLACAARMKQDKYTARMKNQAQQQQQQPQPAPPTTPQQASQTTQQPVPDAPSVVAANPTIPAQAPAPISRAVSVSEAPLQSQGAVPQAQLDGASAVSQQAQIVQGQAPVSVANLPQQLERPTSGVPPETTVVHAPVSNVAAVAQQPLSAPTPQQEKPMFTPPSQTGPSDVPISPVPSNSGLPPRPPSAAPSVDMAAQSDAASGISVNGLSPASHGFSDEEEMNDEMREKLRKLEEDYQKNLKIAKKVFDSRMENLERSQTEKEAQHQKHLEKHEKERAAFEKRRALEEEQQMKRIEQLQKDWDKKREILAQQMNGPGAAISEDSQASMAVATETTQTVDARPAPTNGAQEHSEEQQQGQPAPPLAQPAPSQRSASTASSSGLNSVPPESSTAAQGNVSLPSSPAPSQPQPQQQPPTSATPAPNPEKQTQ